jgi:hypothetical protein
MGVCRYQIFSHILVLNSFRVEKDSKLITLKKRQEFTIMHLL